MKFLNPFLYARSQASLSHPSSDFRSAKHLSKSISNVSDEISPRFSRVCALERELLLSFTLSLSAFLGSEKPTGLFGNPKEPTKPDNDNEYDNDYVDDNDSHLKKKETSPKGESKKDELSLFPEEKIDWGGLMDYFNSTFKGKLPAIKSIDAKRKKAIKARVAQYGKQAKFDVFQLVLDSPFLLGQNDKNWRCTFDWIFLPTKFTNILEGNYNGKRTDTAATRRESVSSLTDLAEELLQSSMPKEG